MVLSDPDATIDTYRAVCEDVLEASAHQERLIEALLTLARSQRGLDRRRPLDLGAITSQVVDACDPTAKARRVDIELAVRSVPLSGDSQLIERLVTNLIDNALHYNHPGGTVQVVVDIHSGRPTLKVANTGPAVPIDEISGLLQPFHRLTADRVGNHDGLGLGLSIVAAIATAHGAHLDIRPRGAGGLEAEVRFPVVPNEPDRNGSRRPAGTQSIVEGPRVGPADGT